MKTTTLIGRILYSLIFIMGVAGHFQSQVIAYAATKGVWLASLTVPASGVLALLGGLSIALGYKTRWGAIAVVAFLVPVTVVMHAFWGVSDPWTRHVEMMMFMKNVALTGGALTFVVHGAGAYSLDARAQRAAIIGRPAALAG
jgi:putative oxidoreductase